MSASATKGPVAWHPRGSVSSVILSALVHWSLPPGSLCTLSMWPFQRPSGASRGCEKGKITWNNLHSFKGNVKHFAAGLLLFLCCLSCLSCQKAFPASRSSGSIPLRAVCPVPPGLQALITETICNPAKNRGCWDQPGSWQRGQALSSFHFVPWFCSWGGDRLPAQRKRVQDQSTQRSSLEVKKVY